MVNNCLPFYCCTAALFVKSPQNKQLLILCLCVFQLFPWDLLVREEAGPALNSFDFFLFE